MGGTITHNQVPLDYPARIGAEGYPHGPVQNAYFRSERYSSYALAVIGGGIFWGLSALIFSTGNQAWLWELTLLFSVGAVAWPLWPSSNRPPFSFRWGDSGMILELRSMTRPSSVCVPWSSVIRVENPRGNWSSYRIFLSLPGHSPPVQELRGNHEVRVSWNERRMDIPPDVWAQIANHVPPGPKNLLSSTQPDLKAKNLE